MIIIANWKAYVEEYEKAEKLVAASIKAAKQSTHTIVLAPPAPFLGAFAPKQKAKVAFAAQDVSISLGGAATGEIVAQVYATLGATYAIVGHSERRAQGDTNAIVAEKIAHALARNLVPILCVGEHERDSEGRYLSFIREEITTAIAPLTAKERAKVIIAYEPLWAIGKSADNAIAPHDLTEMALYIRKVLSELLPGKNSMRAAILYGGAVEPDNIRSLGADTGIDGFLIGHASSDPVSFSALIKQLS